MARRRDRHIGKDGDGAAGPASEIDESSQGDGGTGAAKSPLLDDLAKRPPD